MDHHLSRTFDHYSLDGRAQFPPTIWKPKGLAASYRGGQIKSATKSGLASKWHGIWTPWLNAEGGGMVCSSALGGGSQLCDVNLDECWFCFYFMVDLRGTRASCSVSNNACSASYEVAT